LQLAQTSASCLGNVIGWPFHSVFVSASAGYYAEVEQDSSFD